MQFFKYEGLALCETWSQENDSRRAMHEKIRKIALKSDSFNQKLQRKSYFFVTDASEDTIIIGVISKDSQHIQTWLEEYIKSVGMELKDTRLEEVTFNAIRNMLQRASQRDYIPDDDEVLEQFGLDKLGYRYGRGCRFDEGLIESSSKKEIYATADQLLSNETLIPELDRIYVRKAKSNAAGHPVHYIIQTDDSDIREKMGRLLLQALYARNRLHSKRYCFLELRPGEELSRTVYNCLYKSCFGGTVIVRYLAEDDTEDDYAACGRETVEVLCETMKKYCNQVLTIFCLPRECTTSKALFYENLGNTSFVELKEDFVSTDRAAQFLKTLAFEHGTRANQKLFAKLEPDKGYLAPELRGLFDDWYNHELNHEDKQHPYQCNLILLPHRLSLLLFVFKEGDKTFALARAKAMNAAIGGDVETDHDFASTPLGDAGKTREELPDVETLRTRVFECGVERNVTGFKAPSKLSAGAAGSHSVFQVAKPLVLREGRERVHLLFPFSSIICLSDTRNKKSSHARCTIIRMRGPPRAKMT